MSKGRVAFRQRDLERAIRAARAFGSAVVEVTRDGTIRIIPPEHYHPSTDSQPPAPAKKHAKMF